MNKKLCYSLLRRSLILCLSLCSTYTLAQTAAPIEDLNSPSLSNTGGANVVVVDGPNKKPVSNDSYDQLYELRQEVSTLRGELEQLRYQLQRSETAQKEYYLYLSKRLDALEAGAPNNLAVNANNAEATSLDNAVDNSADSNQSAAPIGSDNAPFSSNSVANTQPSTSQPNSSASNGSANPVVDQDNMEQSYRNAFGQLRAGRQSDGIRQLEQFLKDFPDSQRSADAHFWLGETYTLQGNTEKARQHYVQVVSRYSSYRRVDDIRFKLANIYAGLNDTEAVTKYATPLLTVDRYAERAKQLLSVLETEVEAETDIEADKS